MREHKDRGGLGTGKLQGKLKNDVEFLVNFRERLSTSNGLPVTASAMKFEKKSLGT